MKQKRVYISGAITSLHEYQREAVKIATPLFKQAEIVINDHGDMGVNPIELVPYFPHKQWLDYMIEDLRILAGCDAIFMLSNWEQSKGAIIEHCFAQQLGLDVFYEIAPKK